MPRKTTKPSLDPYPAFENSALVTQDLLSEITSRLYGVLEKREDEVSWHEVRMLAELNATLAKALDQVEDAEGA